MNIIVTLLLCVAVVSAQHHHGNPDTTGNPSDGDGGGAGMTYKDAGFQLTMRSDGWLSCEGNLFTPGGPNHHAPHMVLERPMEWAYHHPFRASFCAITYTLPISFEMRLEIENTSIVQITTQDGYFKKKHTVKWTAYPCGNDGLDDPICAEKILKYQIIFVCLESGISKANINFYFPGSGERAHTNVLLKCNDTDYDRQLWHNTSWGHWGLGFGPFFGMNLLLIFELGIINCNTNNNKGSNNKAGKNNKRSGNNGETSSSETNSDLEETMDDNDDLVVSPIRDRRSGVFPRKMATRVKNFVTKAYVILGFENFILIVAGFGGTLGHFPKGDTTWLDPLNLMHFVLSISMLVMGLVGILFNTSYMMKITFNFTVSLTLVMLGILMQYHEQEPGLAGTIHNVFIYGMIFGGIFKMISEFLPKFRLLFILSVGWATFTLGLGAGSWVIAFTARDIVSVTFVVLTAFFIICWMCFWLFIGFLVNRRRERNNYHTIDSESIELRHL